jgi:chaperone required for assembly of F1-ATPase
MWLLCGEQILGPEVRMEEDTITTPARKQLVSPAMAAVEMMRRDWALDRFLTQRQQDFLMHCM